MLEKLKSYALHCPNKNNTSTSIRRMQSLTVSCAVALSNVSSLATPQCLSPAPQAASLHSSSLAPVASPASLQEVNTDGNHTPKMCLGIVEEARLSST